MTNQTGTNSTNLLKKMSPSSVAQILGEVMQLFLASEKHSDATLKELRSSVLPPVSLNQFRIYRDSQGIAVGWVCWAYFSEQNAKDYMAGDFDFNLEAWNSGEQLWFVDYIAPFGHALKMAEDLKHNVFPDKVAFAPQLDEKGGIHRVRKYFGANLKVTD